MKPVKIAWASILLLVLTACTTTIELARLTAPAKAKVTVVDNRAAAERIYRREHVLDPVQFFGDEDFEVPPLSHFAGMLERSLPTGNYVLDVQKFRVIDLFPFRMSTPMSVSGYGYSQLFPARPGTTDSIHCLVSGTLQSKSVAVSVNVPYKVSPLAGAIKGDPSFKAAVNDCLSKLAEKVSAAETKAQ